MRALHINIYAKRITGCGHFCDVIWQLNTNEVRYTPLQWNNVIHCQCPHSWQIDFTSLELAVAGDLERCVQHLSVSRVIAWVNCCAHACIQKPSVPLLTHKMECTKRKTTASFRVIKKRTEITAWGSYVHMNVTGIYTHNIQRLKCLCSKYWTNIVSGDSLVRIAMFGHAFHGYSMCTGYHSATEHWRWFPTCPQEFCPPPALRGSIDCLGWH